MLGFINKPNYKPNTDKARMGVYFFKNPQILKESLLKEHQTINNEYNLATLMDYYLEKDSIFAVQIKTWKDAGSLDTYTHSKKQINSDKYNFSVDNFLKVTKQAKNALDYKTLNQQFNWLDKMQSTDARFILPNAFGGEADKYFMEYLDHLTLYEYLTFYPIPLRGQKHIFKQVVKSINFLHSAKELDDNGLLKSAVNSFNYSAEQALNILTSLENELGNITVNNQPIKQLKEIIINNKLAFDNLKNSPKLGVLHNNLYFSNIFYLPAISGVKLISPLGNGYNLFGDVRLDYAMLKLNYALKIEQIEKELFKFYNTSENNFDSFPNNYSASCYFKLSLPP